MFGRAGSSTVCPAFYHGTAPGARHTFTGLASWSDFRRGLLVPWKREGVKISTKRTGEIFKNSRFQGTNLSG
jgi:hypothetical protein